MMIGQSNHCGVNGGWHAAMSPNWRIGFLSNRTSLELIEIAKRVGFQNFNVCFDCYDFILICEFIWSIIS